MRREDIRELHYIAYTADLYSIVIRGIYCYRRAQTVPHRVFANPGIQETRHRKRVTPTTTVHDYANLFIEARNATLFAIQDDHDDLCVLRIRPSVMDLEGVMVSDRNAATDGVTFYPVHEGLQHLDKRIIFARRWKVKSDPKASEDRKARKAAEILVPNKVPGEFIFGVYTNSERSRAAAGSIAPGLSPRVYPDLFFQDRWP